MPREFILNIFKIFLIGIRQLIPKIMLVNLPRIEIFIGKTFEIEETNLK